MCHSSAGPSEHRYSCLGTARRTRYSWPDTRRHHTVLRYSQRGTDRSGLDLAVDPRSRRRTGSGRSGTRTDRPRTALGTGHTRLRMHRCCISRRRTSLDRMKGRTLRNARGPRPGPRMPARNRHVRCCSCRDTPQHRRRCHRHIRCCKLRSAVGSIRALHRRQNSRLGHGRMARRRDRPRPCTPSGIRRAAGPSTATDPESWPSLGHRGAGLRDVCPSRVSVEIALPTIGSLVLGCAAT